MNYRFCPVCATPLVLEERDGQRVPVCQNPACRFVFWQNGKPCASVLITDDRGRLLMTVRAVEPDKGKLDFPGGFLREGEHPDQGAKREAQEELGVRISVDGYLGFAVDRYGTDGPFTLNIGVLGHITGGTLTPADDAAAIEWIDPAVVDRRRLAFSNNAKFLDLVLARRVPIEGPAHALRS